MTEEARQRKNARSRAHYAANRTRVLARQQAYVMDNQEKIRQATHDRYIKKRDAGIKPRALTDEQRARKQARAKERKQQRTPEQRERDARYHREWHMANRDRRIALAKARRALRTVEQVASDLQRRYDARKTRYHRDTPFRVGLVLRARLTQALRDKLSHKWDTTFDLLGCSVERAMAHLESLWQPGMTWETYGREGWHIDHIRPCASFDLTDPEQQRKCFHYTNLQPLWATENLSKGKRVDVPVSIESDAQP